MENKQKMDEVFFIIMAFSMVVFIGLIWYAYRFPILVMIFGIDWIQLKIMSYAQHLSFIKFDETIIKHLNFIEHVLTFKIKAKTVSWAEVQTVSSHLGYYNRWLFCLLGLILSFKVLIKMKGEGLKNNYTLTGEKEISIYSMFGKDISSDGKGLLSFLTYGYDPKKRTLFSKIIRIISFLFVIQSFIKVRKEWKIVRPSFLKYQAKQWPVITPSIEFNPNSSDFKDSQALTPPEWLKHYKINLSKKDGLDLDSVEDRFGKQLGTVWNGFQNAEPYVQIICVICALNARNERKKIDGLNEKLAVIWTQNNIEKANELTKELIKPYLNDSRMMSGIEKFTRVHNYTNTALLRLLVIGREKGGVLPSASMLWLKRIDRDLWYGINNMGRSKYHIEGAGIICHYNAEKILDDKIIEPRIDEAIDGLKTYLEEYSVDDLDEHFMEETYF